MEEINKIQKPYLSSLRRTKVVLGKWQVNIVIVSGYPWSERLKIMAAMES
jgi:hypothetical protein